MCLNVLIRKVTTRMQQMMASDLNFSNSPSAGFVAGNPSSYSPHTFSRESLEHRTWRPAQ